MILRLLPVLLLVAGCARQLTEGADQIRSVISDIFLRQALSNIGDNINNRYAVPSHIALDKGLTQIANSINSGIAPSIALRAIAITGISLSSGNTLQQNWATTPVTNMDDLARLRLLYDFAVRGGRFADLERRYNDVGELTRPLSKTIGDLPDGPLLWIDTADACRGNPTATEYGGHHFCFKDGLSRVSPDYPAGEVLTASNLQALFTLWTISTPQVETRTPDEGSKPAAPRTRRLPRASPGQQGQGFFTPPSLLTQ